MKGSQEEAQRALLTAGIIMRADRARLCSALLVVALLHLLVSWLSPSSPTAPGLLRRVLPSLLGIFGLLIAHRMLAIRCVPPLPPPGGGSLLTSAYNHYARRLVGCAAFVALAVASSLLFHLQLLRPCDAPGACASATAQRTAAWAAIVGGVVGARYWYEVRPASRALGLPLARARARALTLTRCGRGAQAACCWPSPSCR